MTWRHIFFGIAILLPASTSVWSNDSSLQAGDTIHVCGDGAGWPPYHFLKREQDEKTQQVIGYDVDVLKTILDQHDLNLTVDMLPWKRCLQEANMGQRYQIALSSSYSKMRDTIYLMTRHYYEIIPHYFYSKRQYSNGLTLRSNKDLLNYKGCGLLGYNYVGFGVSNEIIDTGALNFPQVIKKTHAGHCDYFLARYEIFLGFASIGEKFPNDPLLGHGKVPGVSPDKFYMLVSRNYVHAKALKDALDTGITELEKAGKLKEILSKYLP